MFITSSFFSQANQSKIFKRCLGFFIFCFFLTFPLFSAHATSVVSKTVAPSGGDFTSLAAAVNWFKTNYPDFTTSDIIGKIEITGNWTSADTNPVTTAGLTTGPDNYLFIYTDANNRASAKWETNKYRLEVGFYNKAIDVATDCLRVDGLQIGRQEGALYNYSVIDFDSTYTSASDFRFSNLIVKGPGSSGDTGNSPGFSIYKDNVNLKIWNTVVYNVGANSYTAIRWGSYGSSSLMIYNSVIIGLDSAIYYVEGNTKAIVKNTYAYGTTAAYGGDSKNFSLTTSASNDTTGSPGLQTIPYSTSTFVNVTPGSEDFHLAGTSSPLYHAGTNTSSDPAPLNFTTDIDGDTYATNRSIGVDEVITDPWVITNTATNVTTTAATLNGTLYINQATSVNVFFRWRQKGAGEFNATTPQTKTASTTFSADLTNLATSTIYEYKAVVSWDSQEKEGNLVDFSTDFIPPVPGDNGTITTAAVTTTSLTLNWTKATDDVTAQANLSYRVYYATSNNIDTVSNIKANGTPLNDYTQDINSFDVSGLSPSTLYYFNIIVKDEGGNEAAYTMQSVTTSADATPPTTPLNLSAVTTTSYAVVLSWSTSTDNIAVSGYKIYRCNTSNCTPNNFVLATTTATSYTDFDVAPSLTYTYAVAAYDASNNQSEKSSAIQMIIPQPQIIRASSLSYDDVTAAINQARPGDTVILPNGSVEWTQALIISKGITLKAETIGGVTILNQNSVTGETKNEDPANYVIAYYPNDSLTSQPFRLSGVILDGGNQRWTFMGRTQSGTLVIKNFRLDHCTLQNSKDYAIIFYGEIYGVIDNCTLSGADLEFSFQDTTWSNFTFDYGTANNRYFEDNIVNTKTLTEGGLGGRYCWRYNTFSWLGPYGVNPWFDMHGNMGTGGNYSAMGAEIYGNTIDLHNASVKFFYHRGGKAIIFNNSAFNDGGRNGCTISEEVDDSLNPPANNPAGQPQHISDSYYWNQKYGSSTTYDYYIYQTVDYVTTSEGIIPRWDVHAWHQVQNFNGSSGVGVGFLSQRPTSCTTEGVAWWATDENKLYRWHNGAWELYYTPYTYPHPLRADKVVSVNKIDTGSGARIYANGKFADLATTTSGFNASLAILPIEGNDSQWLDVTINTWRTSGDYAKQWVESSPNFDSTTATLHTIGDLKSNTYYQVKVDDVLGQNISGTNCTSGICLSNASGTITFTYTGSYSSHTFEIAENTEPTPTPTPTPTPSSTPTQAGGGGSFLGGGLTVIPLQSNSPAPLPVEEIQTRIIELKQQVLQLLQQLVIQLLQQLAQLLQQQVGGR